MVSYSSNVILAKVNQTMAEEKSELNTVNKRYK